MTVVNRNGVQFQQLSDFYFKIFKKNEAINFNGVFDVDGFIGLKTKNEHLVFDCAEVVAGNQPGHVHCDALSFEYFRNGDKIFTNSGTYEYNSGKRREYSRASESHNVLKYGQFNQSEVWSSFRMGRQANVHFKANKLKIDDFEVVGTVRGHDFSKKVLHQRTLIKQKNTLIVQDQLEGNATENLNIYLHLSPDYVYRDKKICDRKSLEEIAQIEVSHEYQVSNTEYYPEFGLIEQKETMVIKNVKPSETVVTRIEFYE